MVSVLGHVRLVRGCLCSRGIIAPGAVISTVAFTWLACKGIYLPMQVLHGWQGEVWWHSHLAATKASDGLCWLQCAAS